jgi:YidC/Oxa1 family membrane protein insertase
MMPLMFVFFSITFPSGLALYWATGSLFTIIMQYFTNKRGFGAFGDDVNKLLGRFRGNKETKNNTATATVVSTDKKENTNEASGNKRPDSGAGRRTGPSATKSPKKSGRGKRYI